MKVFIFLILFSFSLFAQKINIAVAANVSYAIDELIKEFNKENPNIDVQVTLGSSGKLTAQIKNGAPYDIFMAANMKYPNSLFEEKLAITKPIIYAKGGLAILSSKKIDFDKNLNFLKDEKIGKIAIANPKTAPYGKAAMEVFINSNLIENLKKKLVFAESISQVVTYSVTATDLGIIAKSSLYSSKMKDFKENINWFEIDSSLYNPIEQGIVITKNGENKDNVKKLYDFLLGKKAKEIYKNYGYIINE